MDQRAIHSDSARRSRPARMGRGNIFWNHFGRQLVLLVLISLALTIPLVLAHVIPLMQAIVTLGVSPKLLLLAVPMFFPLVFYLATPVFVAIALGRFYHRVLADNEITALCSAGISKLAVAKPAIVLSLLATLACLAVSVYLIPDSVKTLQDIRTNSRDYANFRALPEGRFIRIKDGVTMYLHRWISRSEIEDVFLVDQSQPNQSRVLFARKGQFIEDSEKLVLILHRGRIDVVRKKNGKANYSSVRFTQLSQHLPTLRKGARKIRQWQGEGEQTIASLMNPPANVRNSPKKSRKWQGELYRRLVAPFLCLSYGIFCVGVLLGLDTPRRNRFKDIAAISFVIAGLHLTFFVLVQGVKLPGFVMLGVFGAILLVPLAIGLTFLMRADTATAARRRVPAAGFD